MRTIISVFVLSALALTLSAQAPAKKSDAQPAAAKAQDGKNPAAGQNSKKQAEAEADEGTVMIDSRADQEETGRFAAQPAADAAERADMDVPGGMPSSYGQCKGVISEGGRNVMVFENPEDGTLHFVQVTLGKNSVSWKLMDRILRSGD